MSLKKRFYGGGLTWLQARSFILSMSVNSICVMIATKRERYKCRASTKMNMDRLSE